MKLSPSLDWLIQSITHPLSIHLSHRDHVVGHFNRRLRGCMPMMALGIEDEKILRTRQTIVASQPRFSLPDTPATTPFVLHHLLGSSRLPAFINGHH
jgi:hypothetical protein